MLTYFVWWCGLQVDTGGDLLGSCCCCCVRALLLTFTTQCRVHCTRLPTSIQQTPLVWNIWLHHIQQREREREIGRGWERERYAFRSSCFTLWPAPSLFLLFPTQIVIPYLGEGREGKERERERERGMWLEELGVVTAKNSPDFCLDHKRTRQD